MLPIISEAECVLKRLALSRANHSGKIALSGYVACIPRLQLRQSFSHMLFVMVTKTSSVTIPIYKTATYTAACAILEGEQRVSMIPT